MSLLRTIRQVLPIGPDMWEMVAQLHSQNYPQCQCDGKSLKTKYLRLANEKPSTGNPNMSPATLLAKEIKVAIDLKVGNTPADVDDLFGNNDDDDSSSGASAGPPTGAEAPPAGAGVPSVINATTDNNTALTNVSTAARKKTRTNQIVSVMETNTKETRSFFSSMMEHRIQAEEAELRLRRLEREAAEEQRRLDREEDRRRREDMEEIRCQEREERRLEREEEQRFREEAEEHHCREREEERSQQQQ